MDIQIVNANLLAPYERARLEDMLSKEIKNFERHLDKLKIEIKQSKHGKSYLHEIKVSGIGKKCKIASNSVSRNLYQAFNEAIIAALNELKRKLKE